MINKFQASPSCTPVRLLISSQVKEEWMPEQAPHPLVGDEDKGAWLLPKVVQAEGREGADGVGSCQLQVGQSLLPAG
jgi:hypothetical protein